MFGVASCTVESAPKPTSAAADDDSAETTSFEVNRSTPDPGAAPRAVACNGVCEDRTLCDADGGTLGGPCIIPGTRCCMF
jgi:hypothetical protein